LLLPVVTVNSVVCEMETINFSVSISGSVAPTFIWTGPNSFTSNIQSPSISNASTVHVGTYVLTVVNGGCSETKTTIVTSVNPCTGIVEKGNNLFELTAYPNPNNGRFTIKNNIKQNYDIVIYNQLGQLIYEEKNILDSKEFDLSDYFKGMYFATIKVNNEQKNIKLIIE
jgi:hypothetical protein